MNLVLRREPLSLLDDMYETFANRVGYAMPAPAWGSPAAAWGSPGTTRARLDVVEKGDVGVRGKIVETYLAFLNCLGVELFFLTGEDCETQNQDG